MLLHEGELIIKRSRFAATAVHGHSCIKISRLPSTHDKDRRRSRSSVDDAHFQDSFDIPVREVFSKLIPKQLHVMRTRCKLRSSFSTIAPHSGKDHDPAVGRSVAITSHPPRLCVGSVWEWQNLDPRRLGHLLRHPRGNEWNQPGNAIPFALRPQTGEGPLSSITNFYSTPGDFPSTAPGGGLFPYTYKPSAPVFISGPGGATEAISPHLKYPYMYQINFSLQRQIPGRVTLTTAYVGALSHNCQTSLMSITRRIRPLSVRPALLQKASPTGASSTPASGPVLPVRRPSTTAPASWELRSPSSCQT